MDQPFQGVPNGGQGMSDNLAKAAKAIELELKLHSKNLDPKAKSRWKHGYCDGLEFALKQIKKGGNQNA